MDYETLRHAADSWGLLYLTVLFIGFVIYTFRPAERGRRQWLTRKSTRSRA